VRRSATLLPSLLTVGNLFAGFFSIMAATDGRHAAAAIAIVVAAALDLLDGRIARLTGSVSEFGMQLDSLADAVSFGVAPAVLAQQWALVPLDRVGWGAAFLFAACGAIRLARFNSRHSLSDHRYFVGLPIPMGACALAGVVLVLSSVEAGPPPAWPVALMTVILALLMVSPIRYRSFKDADPRGRPYLATALLAAFIALALVRPEAVLALMTMAYVLMGPVEALVLQWRRSRGGEPEPVAETGEADPASTGRGD
jgi:CDP-diacylglycerol--serine O-phosphatidyltransferase